jgi:NTP pyrophosphatase (non-canonical NTP hydrolase)
MTFPTAIADTIRDLQNNIHQANVDAGWWTDLETGERKQRNKGELLMLIVTEIAEAMEGERKDLMDDKLPHRKNAEVELADAFIRILDYCGGFGYDLAGAMQDKLEFNRTREDHKIENRRKKGGKKV